MIFFRKSCSTIITFVWLLVFMNWINMSFQRCFERKACMTNVTFEWLFFSWTGERNELSLLNLLDSNVFDVISHLNSESSYSLLSLLSWTIRCRSYRYFSLNWREGHRKQNKFLNNFCSILAFSLIPCNRKLKSAILFVRVWQPKYNWFKMVSLCIEQTLSNKNNNPRFKTITSRNLCVQILNST